MATKVPYHEISSFSERNSAVASTVRQVLKNLRDNYQKFGKVIDEDLLALSSIFNETLEKAIELVESNKVTYFHLNSNSVGVYQVEGSSGNTYTIFPSVNYCPCLFFKYQVSSGSQITCKHVLATVIADTINLKNSVEVTNEHLKDLLLVSVSLKYVELSFIQEACNTCVKLKIKLCNSIWMISKEPRSNEGIEPELLGTKMHHRNEWNNRNPYSGQFMPANPLPEMPLAFHPIPGVSPGFGIPPSDWVHVPPQTMPWGTPPETQPAVVRFTAGGDFNPHLVPGKRKCDSMMDTLPSKMLVTEEKMAAHMRDLHISDVEPSSEVSNVTCKEEPMEAERLPKLIISDEIKNLKTQPIIPESILKNLEKPEMALVLWQPPTTDLESKLRELRKLSLRKGKKKENDSKEDTEMDDTIETETENNNADNVFRPIDPVPMPPVQNQFFQPVPQFHGYSPFSQNIKDNFQNKYT